MQFDHSYHTTFDKIAHDFANAQGLCQRNSDNHLQPKQSLIGQMRSPVRNYRIQDIVRSLEDYRPISQVIQWQKLKAEENALLKRYRQSVFFGSIQDGVRQGCGVMLYTNGRVYEGHWKDNFKHGKGYQKFPNGATYSGTYCNGKPEGYGTYTWENGQTYQGQWIDGQKHGSGIWRGPNGDSYIGQWKSGQANGYGVHTWVNGDRYEGEFQNCLKHGEGVQYFANGDSYKGMYENGKPEGYGQYYWAMGSFFKGNFKNGLRNGQGVWKRAPGNSDKYEGEYKDDKKQGTGVFIWENGNIYKGTFVDDLKEGYGELLFPDGSVWKGRWQQGEQVEGDYHQQTNKEKDFDNGCQEEYCAPFQRRNFSQGCCRQKKFGKDFRRSERPDQVLELNADSFFEEQPEIYQPFHPLNETQKRFRSRGLCSKKSSRPQLESQKTARSFTSTQSTANKFMKRSGQEDRQSGKKMRQGHSEGKMMSSTFFLYKIHGQNRDPRNAKMKGRVIQTSGGMRQKHICEEIKYFTRNKINPEFC